MRATKTFVLSTCLGLGVLAGGCETIQDNPRTSGTLIGAAAGAGVGALAGGEDHRTEGALIGGAAGAGGGWLIGDQYDKRNKDDDRRTARVRRDRYDEYDDYEARPARYRDYDDDRYDDRYDRDRF